MLTVFVIAVLASLDAGLLAAAVVLLSRPRPAHELAAFLIGCSIGFGLVIVFALHGSQLARHPDPTVAAIVEVTAGALLVGVAIVALAGRSVLGPHPEPVPGRGARQGVRLLRRDHRRGRLRSARSSAAR